jgi:hypothetical protein
MNIGGNLSGVTLLKSFRLAVQRRKVVSVDVEFGFCDGTRTSLRVNASRWAHSGPRLLERDKDVAMALLIARKSAWHWICDGKGIRFPSPVVGARVMERCLVPRGSA